jgi:hypothetical protein
MEHTKQAEAILNCDGNYVAERLVHYVRANSAISVVAVDVSANQVPNEGRTSTRGIADVPSTVNVHKYWKIGVLGRGFTWVEHTLLTVSTDNL